MGVACKRRREKPRGDHCKGRCWTHRLVIKATWGEMKGRCYLWPASSVIEPRLLTVNDSYWRLWQLVTLLTYIGVYHFFIQLLSLASKVSFSRCSFISFPVIGWPELNWLLSLSSIRRLRVAVSALSRYNFDHSYPSLTSVSRIVFHKVWSWTAIWRQCLQTHVKWNRNEGKFGVDHTAQRKI
jgi:hypothetical protein